MTITINTLRPEFARSLAIAARALSNRNSLPILSHLLLSVAPAADETVLTISGTDLDTSIRSCTSAKTDARSLSQFAVPSKPLIDFVGRVSADDFSMEFDCETLKLRCRSGKAKYDITCAPFDDFPIIDHGISEERLIATVSESVLRRALMRTQFAASKEEHKSMLMGVLFEAKVQGNQLNLVATDTHRLAWANCGEAKISRVSREIIPAKPLDQLKAELRDCSEEVKIYSSQNGNNVVFVASTFEMSCRALGGEFPNYEKVVPKRCERIVTFNDAEMAEALNRIDIVSSTASHKAMFAWMADRVDISAQSSEAGVLNDVVDATLEGIPQTCALNVTYFKQMLANMAASKSKSSAKSPEQDARLKMSMNGPLQPFLLEPSTVTDDYWYHILMPMQP